MANNADLTLRLLLKDQASSGLQKFGKTMAGALSVAAVAEFGRQSVLAFAEAEKAQLKLTDAYARFPAMSNVALGALRAYNSELMRKTGFDDDAIASGQAVLAQFKLTGQQIKDVTPLLIDYAAKMDKDIPDAAAMLGKAALGNTRALKELGISYKATGDQATDFANITALVRQKVGGFAEAEAKTAEGALRKLDTLFGELQETVGQMLVPALELGVPLLQTWQQQMDDLVSPVTELADGFNRWVDSMEGGEEVRSEVTEWLPNAALGFGQLGLVLNGLNYINKGLGATLGEVGEAASEETAPGLASLTDEGQEAARAARQLESAWKSLENALSKGEAKDDAVQAIRDLKKELSGADEAFSGTSKAARDNRAAIRDAISAAADYAQELKNPAKQAQYLTGKIREIKGAMEDAGASGPEIRRAVGPLVEVRNRAREAASAMDDLAGTYNVNVVYSNTGTPGRKPHATGGPVVGPGGPTDDAVPAMLSNGEYVIRASSVKRYGLAFMEAINSGRAVGLRRGGRANRPGRGLATGRSPGQSVESARDWQSQQQADRRDYLQGQREEQRRIFDEGLAILQSARDEAESAAKAAQDALDSALESRRQYVEGIATAFKAAAGINGVGVSSGDDIFAARRALNQALGTEGEAEARKNLTDAQNRSTPGYVLGEVRKKLKTMKDFAGNLRKMAAMGYPIEILRDLFAQGLDGARMAEILASADPGIVAGFQQAQAAINDTAASLAAFGLSINPEYDEAVGRAQTNYQNASALSASAQAAYDRYAPRVQPIQTQIYIDGRLIVQALQDYKRSIGGAALGLG